MTLMTPVATVVAPFNPALVSSAPVASIRVVEETRADVAARETLLDAAFGDARFAKTCERLREGRLPAHRLALVAKEGARLVGSVRLWRVDAGGVPALLLGPLAVAESHRSLGVGGALMRASIVRARALGHAAILLVGDAPYYARFGFERSSTLGLAMPGPVEDERFLGLEIRAGALASAHGIVAPTGLPSRGADLVRDGGIRRAA